MATSPIDAALKLAAETFAAQIIQFQTRADSRSRVTIRLEVSAEYDTMKVELAFIRGYGEAVKAATFGALIDEAYRRAGFDDKQAGELQAASDALRALPAPPSY